VAPSQAAAACNRDFAFRASIAGRFRARERGTPLSSGTPRPVRIAFLLLAAAFVACGGSGGGQPPLDTTPPLLSGSDPADGATAVPPATQLALTFSEPLAPSTLALSVSPAAELGAPAWSADHRSATFTPPAPLAWSTTYAVGVAGTDPAGNPLPSATGLSFTTAAAAAAVIDLSGEGAAGLGLGELTDQVKRYQAFRATELPNVSGVDLVVRRLDAGAHGDVTVELYAATGNPATPTGAPLARALLAAERITRAFRAYRVPLTLAGLVPGQPYAVVLGQATPATAHYEWRQAAGPVGLGHGKWTGSAWVAEAGPDEWLRVLVTEGPVAAHQTAELLPASTSGWGFGAPWGQEVKRWQTFTAGALPNLEAAEVQVCSMVPGCEFTCPTDVTLELYATSGGVPVGTALAAATIAAARVGGGFAVLGAPLHYRGLAAGARYAVVLGQVAPRENHYEWLAHQVVDPAQTFGKWDGTGWTDETSFGDGWLRVHLTDDPGPATSVANTGGAPTPSRSGRRGRGPITTSGGPRPPRRTTPAGPSTGPAGRSTRPARSPAGSGCRWTTSRRRPPTRWCRRTPPLPPTSATRPARAIR
jgi:hypothetical protein